MKTLFIIAAGCFMLAISSCNRDWVCTCTDQNGNQTSKQINNELLINARSKCRSMGYYYNTNGVVTSESCSIQ